MRTGYVLALLALLMGGCVDELGADPSPAPNPPTSSSSPPSPIGSTSANPTLVTITDPRPQPAEPLPVIKITNSYRRTLSNGTEWTPPHPGYHGCEDSFEIEVSDKQIWINHYEENDQQIPTPSEIEIARIAVSMASRSPESYYRNNFLTLPSSLPYSEDFTFGNVAPFTRVFEFDDGEVSFDGTKLDVGENRTFELEYEWRRNDGTILSVEESLRIDYLGDWSDAFRIREGHICI